MTKQEAAELLEQLYADYSAYSYCDGKRIEEAVAMAVQALHEVEQDNPEKQKAHWQWFDEETGTPFDGYERDWGWECSHCGYVLPDDYDDPDIEPKFWYCMNCGAQMFSEV